MGKAEQTRRKRREPAPAPGFHPRVFPQRLPPGQQRTAAHAKPPRSPGAWSRVSSGFEEKATRSVPLRRITSKASRKASRSQRASPGTCSVAARRPPLRATSEATTKHSLLPRAHLRQHTSWQQLGEARVLPRVPAATPLHAGHAGQLQRGCCLLPARASRRNQPNDAGKSTLPAQITGHLKAAFKAPFVSYLCSAVFKNRPQQGENILRHISI